MEVMSCVAGQWCHVLVLFEVTLANGTLVVVFKVISVVSFVHDCVDKAIALGLVIFLLL